MHHLIKICGITTDQCVDICLAHGIDTVGLNFYPPSPRFLTLERARQLRERLPKTIQIVGVFVKPTAEVLHQTVKEVGLDIVQLHGTDAHYWHDFTPPPVPLWLAQGISSLADIAHLKLQVKLCRAMNVTVTALLVDAKVPGQEGGTGQVAPWLLLRETTWDLPLILAGGLTPGNVRDAIEAVAPFGVDVASGVEAGTGVKDAEKVRLFVQGARAAFKFC